MQFGVSFPPLPFELATNPVKKCSFPFSCKSKLDREIGQLPMKIRLPVNRRGKKEQETHRTPNRLRMSPDQMDDNTNRKSTSPIDQIPADFPRSSSVRKSPVNNARKFCYRV